MNLKNLTISILLIAIIATATVFAATTIQHYLFPMQANIIGEYKAEIYFEGIKWINNTPVDWGTLNITESPSWTMELTVKNVGTEPFNVSVEVENFPVGWTISWTQNNTIINSASEATADLIVTPTTLGLANWEFYVYIKES